MEIKYGLTSLEASNNLKKYGKNYLSKSKKKSLIKIVLSQFKDSTIYLLIVAGILSLILKEYIDSAIIFSVLVLNTIIGTFQEYRAEKALEALKKLTSPMCKVFRDGKLVSLEVSEITIDDLVYLEEGDIVPADLKLIETNSLRINESLLTGESIPIYKEANFNSEKVKSLGDRLNIAYSSSQVISGNGKGIVINVGMNSEVGKIAKMINEENKEKTPLENKLEKVSKFLGIFTIVLALIVFLIGILLSFDSLEILIFSISLAVAAIPEGLPAVVTIVLSIGIKKMVKSKAIVRNLNAVETLGSVDVVCCDKTGTITKNELEVREVYSLDTNNKKLYETFLYCNNAYNEIGDPLEVSLLKYLRNNGFFREKEGERIKEIPFSSDRKMMSVIHKIEGQQILYCKGAFDVLINKCSHILVEGKEEIITNKLLLKIKNKVEEMENKAYRVLAFAYSYSSEENNLVLAGIVGFFDSPREGIQNSIELMKKAGINVLMITGDHINTAYSLSKEIGILKNIEECISGDQLDSLLDENKPIDKYKVFARVNPSHKLKIVDYYKKKNKVVAMTGDGVNDAPALKKADVGIAMGNGSEVAKSASDIILIDNNFKTIEKAIEEGRNIFINIKKAVLFLLSSNLGEILSVVFFLIFRLPLPLLSIHILWVNLISDSFPALALGSDKKFDDIMNEPPRNKNESLFKKNGTFIIVFYGVLIFVLSSIGYLFLPIKTLLDLDLKINLENIRLILNDYKILTTSRTYAFTILGISQLFHMIGMSNIRANVITILKNKNTWRLVAFLLGFTLQILVTEIPIFIDIFKTTKLSLNEWIYLTIISSAPLLFHQLFKKEYKTNL